MKYRAGVIGCGRIGSRFDNDWKRTIVSSHAGAYTAVDSINLVAVSDINENNLDICVDKWKVPSGYKNYEEMLEEESLDIVSICTWPSNHYEITKKAVESGVKGVFCEKPIADDWKNAQEMVKICNDNDVILQIDHQRRFCNFHQNIRKYLEKETIQTASFHYTAGIWNTGTHVFDLLRFFLGDAEWIVASESKNLSHKDEDKNYDGVIKFKNGVFCSVHSCDHTKYLIFEMDIITQKHRIIITHSGFDILFYSIQDSTYFSGYKELYESKIPSSIDNKSERNFMVNGVKHLIECIEKQKKSISSGEDGLKSLELIFAFQKSAMNNNQKIQLPLKK